MLTRSAQLILKMKNSELECMTHKFPTQELYSTVPSDVHLCFFFSLCVLEDWFLQIALSSLSSLLISGFAQWAAPTENQSLTRKRSGYQFSLLLPSRNCRFCGGYIPPFLAIASVARPHSHRYDSHQVLLTAPLPPLNYTHASVKSSCD